MTPPDAQFTVHILSIHGKPYQANYAAGRTPDADGGICAVPEGEGGFDSRSSDCQGLIIGCVVGGIVRCCICAGAVFMMSKKKKGSVGDVHDRLYDKQRGVSKFAKAREERSLERPKRDVHACAIGVRVFRE